MGDSNIRVAALRTVFCLAFLAFSQNVSAQRIELGQTAAVDSGGWHPLYEMKADPDNPSNLIVCGAKSDAKHNAFYGFVDSSTDGGKTWRQGLEDRNSTFESEDSCAFGAGGTAYFIASASRVIDGAPHHELGTTRIYVSHDSGRTWRLSATTGWTDWSTAVVDTNPGTNQNRLYIFFNNLQTFYNSIGDKKAVDAEAKASNGTRVGMISYKDGDASVAGPFSSAGMATEAYHGAYPAPALVLKDGTIAAFFTTGHKTESGVHEYLVELITTNATRSALGAPTRVGNSLAPSEHGACGSSFLEPGGAYDGVHNRIYFAYPEIKDQQCQLFITNSDDNGKTWANATPIWSPDKQHNYENLSLAVNNNGMIGMVWQDESRSGCWQFATSADGGKTLSRSQELGTCSKTLAPSAMSTAYLWTSFFQADAKEASPTININLRNALNAVWRDQDAVVATSDGEFHAVWSDLGNGDGGLRSATIRVTAVDALIAAGVKDLQDVTTQTTILFGDEQDYDPKTNVFTVNITVRNDTGRPLKLPVKLVVSSVYKDFGFAEIANADNRAPGAGAIWDVSGTISGAVFAPGATSRPFALKFRYLAKPDLPRDSDDILGLSVKVYAKP
jgi:hypothetical protein